MADNPYLMDEGKIPSNWSPAETGRPLGAPAAPVPHDMPQFFSGSMPPALQHDVSFVGTEVGTPRIPKYSLMPFGNQANPFTNAAAQSTVINGGGTPAPPEPDIESIGINQQPGTSYTVQVSDRDTLIALSNNSGGTVILPGPTTGTFQFLQVQTGSGGHSATIAITNTKGNLMIVSAKTSDGGLVVPNISDSNGNAWHVAVIGLSSGNIPTTIFYAYNIAGGANTITITNIGSSTFCLGTVAEYSGFGTTDPFVSASIFTNNSGTLTTGAINSLVISDIRTGSLTTLTSPTPWTTRFNTPGSEELFQDQFIVAMGSTVFSDSIPTAVGVDSTNAVASFATSTGPSAANFPAGWFTYIENRGTGTFSIQSRASIDGSLSPISLAPNQGVLIVYDGFNWFTVRGMFPVPLPVPSGGTGRTTLTANSVLLGEGTSPVNFAVPVSVGFFLTDNGPGFDPSFQAGSYQIVQQAGTSRPKEPRLNFLAPITATDNPGNTSTDIAVPVFVGDSGSGGVKGLVPAPAAGDAAAGKFLFADGTWKVVASSTPTAVKINGAGVSENKQFYFNGVVDVVTIWGVNINGVPDGG